MARCAGLTAKGDQCSATASPGGSYCYLHDPRYAKRRKADATKAGKSKGNAELGELKNDLMELFKQMKAGKGDAKRAGVAGQLANAMLRALALEKDLKEQEEIVRRLERLEELL
jgi:hypothetical protein